MSVWIIYADPVQTPTKKPVELEQALARLGLRIIDVRGDMITVDDRNGALEHHMKGRERRKTIAKQVGLLAGRWAAWKAEVERESLEIQKAKHEVPGGICGGQEAGAAGADPVAGEGSVNDPRPDRSSNEAHEAGVSAEEIF